MNTKIQILWYKAQMGYNDQQCDPEVMEKFVELILIECCDVIINSDPNPKAILHEPYRRIMNNILEHFEDDQERHRES